MFTRLRLTRMFCLCAAALIGGGASASAAERVALVIGNSAYQTMSRLNNPSRDAAALGDVLRANGFEVMTGTDLDRGAFLDVLEDFRLRAGRADVAIVYYAGHGMEVAGRNIVAPIDVEIGCTDQRVRRAVRLETLFETVAGARNQIVLLDSCRDDPFPNCKSKSANSGASFRGLERVESAAGNLLVANATLSGQQSSDGEAGTHSPFAAALIDRLSRAPGRPIYLTLNEVASDVRAATDGRQVPEVISRGGLADICLSSTGCDDAAVATGDQDDLRRQIEDLRSQLQALAVPKREPEPSSPPRQEAAVPRAEPPERTAPPPALGGLAGDTVREIEARGRLSCGVNQGLPGFSAMDSRGVWRGLDADTCRAVAAALLGDATKVKFVPLSAKERFTALQAGDIDVLIRNTSYTVSRDTQFGLKFVGPNFHDGLGFIVPRALGVSSAHELGGASICLMAGTTSELEVANFFHRNAMRYELVAVATQRDAFQSYAAGRCDATATDASALYLQRELLASPPDHVILPERLSQEILGPYVREGDSQWLSIVKWTLNAMVAAEDLGVSSANVDAMRSSADPSVRRLLGVEGDLGAGLGLAPDWAYQVIRQVGNYAEVFERNLGDGAPFRMERGLNALAAHGGLFTTPPLR